ncbi:hypothetical protein ACFFWD_06605 [Bradyrhizobium erythrophlei]|uniref:hypothetical protein n=1 Tax=Bradyrhizobium erythrophlei TaxID=1437360 RepID=UPI0035EF9B7A
MPVDDEQHLAQRGREKAEAVAAIEAALAVTASGPDGWERLCLAQAISWLYRGAYLAARANAALALTPANERAPQARGTDPVTESFTTEALRRALAEAVAQPVSRFPILGPIIFTG